MTLMPLWTQCWTKRKQQLILYNNRKRYKKKVVNKQKNYNRASNNNQGSKMKERKEKQSYENRKNYQINKNKQEINVMYVLNLSHPKLSYLSI